MKLERIEGALKDQVGKGGTLARIMSRQMDKALLPDVPKSNSQPVEPVAHRWGLSSSSAMHVSMCRLLMAESNRLAAGVIDLTQL